MSSAWCRILHGSRLSLRDTRKNFLLFLLQPNCFTRLWSENVRSSSCLLQISVAFNSAPWAKSSIRKQNFQVSSIEYLICWVKTQINTQLNLSERKNGKKSKMLTSWTLKNNFSHLHILSYVSAEREGFEPPLHCLGVKLISSQSRSTALAPLRSLLAACNNTNCF